MENVYLPMGRAIEPDEEAYQPQCSMSQPTFAGSETQASQNSIRDTTMSQPTVGISHRERMLWLQQRRAPGLWAQCDECARWRFLPHVLDCHELPAQWYCRMNPDSSVADCSAPQAPIRVREEEDLIHSKYSAGSVVWARLAGWPWWPAMVDDCPDLEQFYWLDGFSDIPTYYNVVFFDAVDVTRAWIAPEHLKPYGLNKKMKSCLKDNRYKKRLEVAVAQADDAEGLPLASRLAKYSFAARYPGAINHPRMISEQEIQKFKNRLSRKYNIDFSELGSNDNVEASKSEDIKKSNVILLGTPKKKGHGKTSRIAKEIRSASNEGKNSVAGKYSEDVQAESKAEDPIEESAVNVFKEPDSMAVQIGSTVTSAPNVPIYDNDTTKMYVSGSDSEIESISALNAAVRNVIVEPGIVRERMTSPSSDDFDF